MKIRAIDLITPSRWRAFWIFLIQKHLHWMGEKPAPIKHEVEQYMARYIKCSECLKKGSCTHCGCDIPGRMHIQTDECSDGKWGVFLTEEEWDTYKIKYNLKFKLKIKENEYEY